MIHASEIGAAVPDSCDAVAYSVHDTVINLQDENTGLLVSIVTRAPDMTAMSIRVGAIPEAFRQIGPDNHSGGRAGVRDHAVRVGARRIRIENGAVVAATPAGMLITWTDAIPRFSGRLQLPRAGHGEDASEPAITPRAAVPSRLSWLRSALMTAGSRDGLLTAVVGGEPSNIYARRASDILSSSSPVPDRLAGLVGLGPGFTPSGDDFICGALAADTLLAPPESQLGVGPIGRRLRPRGDENARAATTPGGATLVTLACKRSFPRYLVSFLEIALQPDEGLVADARDSALDEALRHGASSGTDTVAGFLWMADRLQT